jgi:hypothetical protein
VARKYGKYPRWAKIENGKKINAKKLPAVFGPWITADRAKAIRFDCFDLRVLGEILRALCGYLLAPD